MTQPNKIFEILHNASRASKFALDLENRELFPTVAVVTNNKDPENHRRIKVALPASPGLESDWIRPLQTSPALDPPLPQIGSTVLYLSVDGTLNSWYLNCINDTNPPLEKADPVNDHRERTPGKRILDVVKDYLINVSKDLLIKVMENILVSANEDINFTAGKSIRFSNEVGAFLELNASGTVLIGDSFGHIWTLGGNSGNDWIWDANNAQIKIINANNFSINGQSITVIGAKTDDNQTVVTKGY